jgi:hypothetical protein
MVVKPQSQRLTNTETQLLVKIQKGILDGTITMQALKERCGIAETTSKYWFNGKSKPNKINILKIARNFLR